MYRKVLAGLAVALAACGEQRGQRSLAAENHLIATGAFVSVYQDALTPGWSNYSWATNNVANPAPVSSGTASIAVTYTPWSGLNFMTAGLSAQGLDFVDLKVNGGVTAGSRILVRLGLGGGTYGAIVALGGYCDGGSIPANAFVRCQVPLSALGATSTSKITALVLQEGAGKSLPAMFFDEVGFSSIAQAPPAQAPLPPTNVVANVSATSAAVSWTASTGATGYNVYRAAAAAGPFAMLDAAPVKLTSFVDNAVTSGATYFYAVTALNAAGESAQSAPVSATIPLPPPPPSGASVFNDPFLWTGDHAATLPAGGNTVWLNPDTWDVRGDTEYNAASYLTTLVQQEKGYHVDIHKAASTNATSAVEDNTTWAPGGDGSRGIAAFHLDFEDILSARLRNPMLITSESVPGVVQFRAPRFVTTGHWWEVAITPADRVTQGEYTSVPAANAGLAGPFGTGYAVNSTAGVGNGHTPAEDSVNFVFQGYPDVPCSTGWFVHPEVKATLSGTRTNVWVPVTAVGQLAPTDPSEIDVLYQYRLEFRPSGITFYADWGSPGVLTKRGTYPFPIPWSAVHVHLIGAAYQADHHPQAPCYQGQVREIHWSDVSVSPVKWATTSIAPHDTATDYVERDLGWTRFDLRDIQRYGAPTADGLPRPNTVAYDRAGSMAYASLKVWAAQAPNPVTSIDLPVDVTSDQATAAEARFLYDIRYTGTATLKINGVTVGNLTPATTVPVAGPGYTTTWVRRAVKFDPSLLHAGSNAVHLDLIGQVALDRLQLEFAHAQ